MARLRRRADRRADPTSTPLESDVAGDTGRETDDLAPQARRPARTRLDPGTRRGQILDAAESVLRGGPPSELTFEAVAERAGVSRALVYNYFGDRSGLLAAVELRLLDQLNAALHASIDASLAPVEQLEPLAESYLAFARQHGVLWQVLAVGGVRHPSLEAARRVRVERLATLWGGTPSALAAARCVTVSLEAATIGWDGSPADVAVNVNMACRVLAGGLPAALEAHQPVPPATSGV